MTTQAHPPAPEGAAGSVELDDLRLFVVLAEELHFSRAAVRLHLSQPGLSYRVKRLEDTLGYELLARTRRSVRLTAAGEALLDGARRLLGDAQRVVDDAGRVARGELATLRVAFDGTALYSLLPGVLHDPVGIALPDDHPLAAVEELALADLADEPFVLFPRELEPQTYDRYTDACVAAGFAPKVAHQATGLPTILGLVAGGVGVAFAAGSVAANLTRSGVVFRPLTEPAPQLITGPAWREQGAHPAVRLFCQVIIDVAAADQSAKSPLAQLLLD